MKKILILMMLCLSLLLGSGNGGLAFVAGVVPISLSEADKLHAQGGVYFYDMNDKDVREKDGYIAGSISLAGKEGFAKLLPKDKDAYLIFYGQNRLTYKGPIAAKKAMDLGYKHVYSMTDGIEGWNTSGRPVVKENIIDWEKARGLKEFTDTIHSRMIFSAPPACRECHAKANAGIRVADAGSKDLINANCASCHKKAASEFEASAHSMQARYIKKENENKERPTCISCHLTHLRDTNKGPNIALYSQKQIAEAMCISCHEDEGISFRHTWHGKAMYLAKPGKSPKIASCSDCHAKHLILNKNDFNAATSSINRKLSCIECHAGANANFANFIAHPDHTDPAKSRALFYTYIFMTALVVGVFVFFGLHTLLWSIRLIALRLKYPKEWKAAKQECAKDPVKLRRFSTFHRVQHVFMALSFLGLAFSGLPQKFYEAPWAQGFMGLFGGIVNATTVHHICAVVMFAVFFSHIGEILVVNWRRRELVYVDGKFSWGRFFDALFGPDSLMPNMQDIRDMSAHIRWFIGLGSRPQFDRWTYWEKFDYLAVFWGMLVIGLSGLILWFPVFFSLALPGYMLNVASLVHSDEAFLAVGFIFAIHFFNTHFRADRFPMDMVIFSGNVSSTELDHERTPWIERLKKSGKYEKLLVKKSNFASYKWAAKLLGFCMLGAGLVLLGLIIYAYVEGWF